MLAWNSDKRNVIGIGGGVTNFGLHVINFGHCRLQFHVGRDESLADRQTVRSFSTLRRCLKRSIDRFAPLMFSPPFPAKAILSQWSSTRMISMM
jgi:hypothetical protein